MAPISAESNVCCGLDSLETLRDMAELRLSEPTFPQITGVDRRRVHIIDADESIRNCDAATMLARA